MLRRLFAILAMSLAASGSATAGHHHHYFGFGIAVHSPAYVAVHAAPVVYAAPPVVYQPAYVVPTVAGIYAPMVPTVSSYYAPQFSTAGYYLAPSAAYVRPVGYPLPYAGYDEVTVDLRYHRHGGFRYEVDYDN